MSKRAVGFDGLRAELARRRRRRLAEGGWFMRAMQRHAQRVLAKQLKRAHADVLRAKFTDLSPEALCRKTVRRACITAAITGAVAGALITAAELFALLHLGHPVGFAIVVAFAEFALLERMQIRMVFTLTELHGLRMGHDHVHEVSALYGHVLKVKGATRVAAYGRQGALILFRTVGVRFAQRAAVKFAIPIVAIVMGGLLNFLLTAALGRHTNEKFRKQALIDQRLDRLLAHDDHCQRLLISLMTVMAASDGIAHKRERELILRTMDGLGLAGEERQALLDDLDEDATHLLATLAAHPDDEFRGLVLEVMTLAAVADGAVSENEHRMLGQVAEACGHELDHDLLIDEHEAFLSRKNRKARARARS